MRIVVAFLALAALAAQADIYKWVDAQGQTQYGEVPPAGVKATKMGVASGNEVAAPEKSPEKSKEPEKAKEPEKKDAPTGSKPEERAARCKAEKEQLAVLESGNPVHYTNDKGGLSVLPPAKLEATKNDVRALVKKYCD